MISKWIKIEIERGNYRTCKLLDISSLVTTDYNESSRRLYFKFKDTFSDDIFSNVSKTEGERIVGELERLVLDYEQQEKLKPPIPSPSYGNLRNLKFGGTDIYNRDPCDCCGDEEDKD